MNKILNFISIIALSISISSCAQLNSDQNIRVGDGDPINKVTPGVIVAKRIIAVDNNSAQAYEYKIKVDNGDVLTLTQAVNQPLSLNQRILIVYGAKTRIVPENTRFQRQPRTNAPRF